MEAGTGAAGGADGADAAVTAAGAAGADAAVTAVGCKGLPSGPGMNKGPFWPQAASNTSTIAASSGLGLTILASQVGSEACVRVGAHAAAVRHKLPSSGS